MLSTTTLTLLWHESSPRRETPNATDKYADLCQRSEGIKLQHTSLLSNKDRCTYVLVEDDVSVTVMIDICAHVYVADDDSLFRQWVLTSVKGH